MTKEQAKQLRDSGTYTPDQPIQFVCPVAQVVPPVQDNIAHVEVAKPLDPKNFNGVSLQDLESLHQYRGMDELHKPDAIAKEFNRATKLTEHLSKVGDKKFVDDWFKYHPQR